MLLILYVIELTKNTLIGSKLSRCGIVRDCTQKRRAFRPNLHSLAAPTFLQFINGPFQSHLMRRYCDLWVSTLAYISHRWEIILLLKVLVKQLRRRESNCTNADGTKIRITDCIPFCHVVLLMIRTINLNGYIMTWHKEVKEVASVIHLEKHLTNQAIPECPALVYKHFLRI